MKAKEAPEKIYISNHSSGFTYNWHLERLAEKDIEYTRTDAFIEKAIKFFAPHIQDNSGGYDRKRIIEDFKNYMKGE